MVVMEVVKGTEDFILGKYSRAESMPSVGCTTWRFTTSSRYWQVFAMHGMEMDKPEPYPRSRFRDW